MTLDQFEDEMNMLLDEMSDEDLISLHNAVSADYSSNDLIYDMSDLDDVIGNQYNWSPSEIIWSLDPNFDINDSYFVVTDDEYLVSFRDLYSSVSPFDKDTIINAVVDFGTGYNNSSIEELLSQLDDEFRG